MLERIVAMASNPKQLIVDPFGGSGTTFYAAEKLTGVKVILTGGSYHSED